MGLVWMARRGFASSFEALMQGIDMILSSSWNVGHLDCLGTGEDKFLAAVLAATRGPFPAARLILMTKRMMKLNFVLQRIVESHTVLQSTLQTG
jgi:hypothetical protein